MQISRHWRLKAKRYRLEGVRYSNGEVGFTRKYMYSYGKEGEPRSITNEVEPIPLPLVLVTLKK